MQPQQTSQPNKVTALQKLPGSYVRNLTDQEATHISGGGDSSILWAHEKNSLALKESQPFARSFILLF